MTEPPFVNVSVIIATYNRALSLERLLRSIEAAKGLDSISLDVLVVDNGSSDETYELLKKEKQKPNPYNFTILSEPKRGKAHALNLALMNATGDLVLVVDDDVVIDPLMILKHLECYQSSRYDAVQGRILPGTDFRGKEADLDRLREYNIPVIDYGDSLCDIRGLTGTNMSFKRDIVNKVGGFDVRLGPGAAGFSEDTEFSMRLRKAGYKIGYTPHAIVYHELNPGRYGRAYSRDVQYRKGISRSIYRHDSILFKVLPDLLANSCRYVIYRIFGLTQKSYKTEGRMMKCWGHLRGKLTPRARIDRRDRI
jgi:GT2 family glycosyltransferase